MADEILVKYGLDLSAVDNSLNKVNNEFSSTEAKGKKTFNTIGDAASSSAPKIDAVGQSAAKAGRQFNGLQNSINQVTRELPAFAVSANIGFLAISNNIPILIDEINKLKAANAALAAQGQAGIPVWKQVISSFFSWNSLLSVGVTLLTIFGGKIIEFIAGSQDSAAAQKKEAEEIKNKNEQLKTQQDLINNLNVGINQNIDAELKRRAASEGGADQQKRQLELLKARGVSEKEILEQQQIIAQIELDDLKLRLNNLELYGEARLETLVKIQDKENEIKITGLKLDRAILQEEIDGLKRSEEAIKAQGNGTYEIHKQILIREQGLFDENSKERMDKITELDAFEKEYLHKQIEDENKARIEGEQTLIEAQRMASDNRLNIVRGEFKEIQDKTKAKLEGIEIERKATFALAKDETKSFRDREKALKDSLKKGLISQQEYAETSKDIEKQKNAAIATGLSELAGMFGAIAAIAGEGTEASKALAIAQATIDTYLAAQKVYAATAGLGPIIAGIAAGVATVAGLARVQQIISVEVPKPQIGPKATYFQSASGFASGIVDLNGHGTGTSDDIPAWLSRGESVIKAKATAAKKDELIALNYSVLDYEKLIQDKYVKPALEAERKKNVSFAENIAQAIAIRGAFNDKGIIKAINKNKPASKEDIDQLATKIHKMDRKERFLKKHL